MFFYMTYGILYSKLERHIKSYFVAFETEEIQEPAKAYRIFQ